MVVSDGRAIRVLIVDDEPHARSIVRRMLAEEPGYEIVGEATGGRDAVRLIQTLAPDLVFLDVQMPGLNGLEVIDEVGVGSMPQIIFVTAFDDYALNAFDVHAVDYLLKPFSRLRFRSALERAGERLRSRSVESDVAERLRALLQEVAAEGRRLERLAVRSGDGVAFLPLQDIIWIEADGKAARAHATDRSHPLRESMKEIEGKLGSTRFLRVHRSAIVNADHVAEIHPMFKGSFLLVLSNGVRLATGPTYRDRIEPLIDNDRGRA